jgi:hypothetical protein
LIRAGNQRADEIAKHARYSRLLARRLDKGRGRSQRWQIGDEIFETGTWGNAGGYRYTMEHLEFWMTQKLQEGGVKKDRAAKAVMWVTYNYRWRALRELW